METIYDKAQRKYPFEQSLREAYVNGAEEQKRIDLNALEYAFNWYVSDGRHLKYERALELFKQRFHNYLHDGK